MNKHKITSKFLNDRKKVTELLAKQREVTLVEKPHDVTLIENRQDDFPHPVNEIWGPNSMPGDQFYRVIGALRNGRDYGEYCTDFIEENAIELYLNGVDLGQVGIDLKARNPKEFSKINCGEAAVFNGIQNVKKASCSQKKQPISEIIRYTAHKLGEE